MVKKKYIGKYQVVESYNIINKEKNLAEFIRVYEVNIPKIVIVDCTSDIKNIYIIMK